MYLVKKAGNVFMGLTCTVSLAGVAVLTHITIATLVVFIVSIFLFQT